MKIADTKTRADWINNKHMKAFNFYKEDELKEVDIIIDSPVSFNQAVKSAIQIKMEGISLPVISIQNLIKMKEIAGRLKDKLDIQELKKIKELRKRK